jgi:hypothetical protein
MNKWRLEGGVALPKFTRPGRTEPRTLRSGQSTAPEAGEELEGTGGGSDDLGNRLDGCLKSKSLGQNPHDFLGHLLRLT